MNGHKLELEWTQGTAPHKAWAEDEEGARLVMEALKLHPSVESVRLVHLIENWTRPEKVMRAFSISTADLPSDTI